MNAGALGKNIDVEKGVLTSNPIRERVPLDHIGAESQNYPQAFPQDDYKQVKQRRQCSCGSQNGPASNYRSGSSDEGSLSPLLPRRSVSPVHQGDDCDFVSPECGMIQLFFCPGVEPILLRVSLSGDSVVNGVAIGMKGQKKGISCLLFGGGDGVPRNTWA